MTRRYILRMRTDLVAIGAGADIAAARAWLAERPGISPHERRQRLDVAVAANMFRLREPRLSTSFRLQVAVTRGIRLV